KKEIGDIGARDEQHRAGEPLKNDQRTLERETEGRLAAGRGNQSEVLAQKALSRLGKFLEEFAFQFLFLELAIEHLHGRLRLIHRDAWLEPAEEIKPCVALVVDLIPGRRDGGLHRDRNPHVRGKSDVGALEIRRGDTDYSERGAVQ